MSGGCKKFASHHQSIKTKFAWCMDLCFFILQSRAQRMAAGGNEKFRSWLIIHTKAFPPSFIIIKSCHSHTNLIILYEMFCPNFNTREISWKAPDDKSKSSQRFCLLLTTSVTYLQSVKSQNMILSSSPRSNKSIIILFSRFFLDHRTNRFNNREGNSSAIKNRQRALLSPQ